MKLKLITKKHLASKPTKIGTKSKKKPTKNHFISEIILAVEPIQ